MAHLLRYAYKGYGERVLEKIWYSQAVRVGDRIECSGQGGWDPATSKIHEDINDEIDQAFSNVDLTLKDAGGKGWSQVYRVNLYLVDINDESFGASVRNLKKWMPNHQPLFTVIGVKQLGSKSMRVEVEVVAHDEEGAKKAAAESAAKQT